MRKGDEVTTGCAAIALFLAVAAAFGFAEAFAIRWAWNAFAVPTLHVAAINLVQGFALALLLSLIGGVVRRS